MRLQSVFLVFLGCVFPASNFSALAWVPPLSSRTTGRCRNEPAAVPARSGARAILRCSPIPKLHDGERKHPEEWWKSSVRSCQTAVASSLLYLLLLMNPAVSLPSPAHAITPPDDAETLVSVALPPPPTVQANAIEEALLPKPDALGTMTDDNTIEPIFLKEQSQDEEDSVLDEVWSLIDKYYIDRTFGGNNDWNKVRQKYKFLMTKASSNEARFKLVTEMVASLGDKYSRILDPQQYAAIQKYDLIGVGVTLMPNADKNIIVGAPPIPGSEADKAGMKVGDFVTAINGLPTTGRTAFDIIDQISEDPNAGKISMSVRPKGSEAEAPVRELTMARSFIEIKNPVSYKISETRSDGTKVGYIKIKEFNSLVKGSLEQALSELEAAGANAYVIDIRQNTGGAFQSAVEISGLFMEDRVATYVVDSTGVRLPFRTTKGTLAIDKEDPLVIWIDGRSASASEVFAGSLRDNCRAVLVGDKSFGKGLIQAVYGLKNGAGLVLTVARYVTPADTDIQGVGIKPDLDSQYLPFGPLGFGTDTSRINFADIKNRLSENACQVPAEIE